MTLNRKYSSKSTSGFKQFVLFMVLCFAMLPNNSVLGQQEAQFTHYSFNTLSVNPAYAGSRDVLTVTALHRSQWVSFPGAPITQTLNLHSPAFNDKIGLGLSLINDKAGPLKSTGAHVDFSYKIKVSKKGSLAFGLKAGLDLNGSDLNGLDVVEANDPNFEQTIQNQISPNFGFGLYYRRPRFYAGFSAPRLLQNASLDLEVAQRHYYLIAGNIFNINQSGSIKLKPTALVRVTKGAPLQFDITALLYYKDFLWAGPMFRTTDAFGVLVGVQASDQFSLGYSFDWSYGNSTGRLNGGSHEILLRYDFFFNNKLKIESPRYF